MLDGTARRLEPLRRDPGSRGGREVRLTIVFVPRAGPGGDMTPRHDWKSLVAGHARATGAPDLPRPRHRRARGAPRGHLHRDARGGRVGGRCAAGRRAALAESPLAVVPRSRRRIRRVAGRAAAPVNGLTGLGGDLRFAWRQVRRSPVVCRGRDRSRSDSAPAPRPRSSASSTRCCCARFPSSSPSSSSRSGTSNAEKALPRERISPVTFMDDRDVSARVHGRGRLVASRNQSRGSPAPSRFA